MLLMVLFGFLLAVSFAIVMAATRPAAASKSMQQRLITIQQPSGSQGDDSGIELQKTEKRDYAALIGRLIQEYEFSKQLQVLLLHADSTMSVGTVVVASAVCGLVTATAALFFGVSTAFAPVALAAGGAMPWGYLRFKRSRRLDAFNAALPDAIELMARALQAGHSIASSIELIAEQSPEPLGGEFAQVYQQQKFGIRFRDALVQLGGRVPSKDLQFLITAILVQKETGGDLTEILVRTAYVIRERSRIEGEVRTHTAQGRLTGWILGLLPVIMLGLINIVSPGYSSMLFHDPTGQKLLYAGGVLILIGGMVIRKVVDVEV